MDGSLFPQQAGELVLNQHAETPSRSAASSRSGIDCGAGLNPSPNPQMQPLSDSTQPEAKQLQIITDITRGTPGELKAPAISRRNPGEVMAAKQKSQFYGAVFAHREPAASVRERVSKDSIITAEIKTNVIIKDEYTLMTALSTYLSERYSRPQSSILVSLSHSSCLLLGGSFEPAYMFTLNALPPLVAPTMNKRNAALIASFMAQELKVCADRGVIRFQAIEESCLATNGSTVLDDIESCVRSPPTPWRTTFSQMDLREPVEGNADVTGGGSGGMRLFNRKSSKKELKEKDKNGKERSKSRPREKERDEKESIRARSRQRSRVSVTSGQPGVSVEAVGQDPKPQSKHLTTSFSKSFPDKRDHATSKGESKEVQARQNDATTAQCNMEERIAQAKAKLPDEIPNGPADEQVERVVRMGKRRSFLQMFGRS